MKKTEFNLVVFLIGVMLVFTLGILAYNHFHNPSTGGESTELGVQKQMILNGTTWSQYQCITMHIWDEGYATYSIPGGLNIARMKVDITCSLNGGCGSGDYYRTDSAEYVNYIKISCISGNTETLLRHSTICVPGAVNSFEILPNCNTIKVEAETFAYLRTAKGQAGVMTTTIDMSLLPNAQYSAKMSTEDIKGATSIGC